MPLVGFQMAASWAYTKCLVTEYWSEIEKKKLIKQINGKGNSSAPASTFDLTLQIFFRTFTFDINPACKLCFKEMKRFWKTCEKMYTIVNLLIVTNTVPAVLKKI